MNKWGIPLATSTWSIREKWAAFGVISSGKLTMGQQVKALEHEFADFIGSKWAIMTNSGSSANLLASAALKLKYEVRNHMVRNEILVPTVSWSTTYFPWHQLGFSLKFIDVSDNDFNMDVDKLLQAIDEKTAGICVVHLLGATAKIREIKKIADEAGVFLMEDCCEALGAKFGSKNVGTFGDIGTFSTYFSHHISTGEGGFAVTNDDFLAHTMISLRAHGWLRDLPNDNFVHNKVGNDWLDRFRFYLPGYNLRPMEVQAAPGRVQLRRLNGFNAIRIENANHYRNLITEVPWLTLQDATHGSSWFAFGHLISSDSSMNRTRLVRLLEEHGIQTRPLVTGDFTQNPVISLINTVNSDERFPVASRIESTGFMIGNHPKDLRKHLDKLVEFFKSVS